ncbi:MAG: hypothetical protein R3352_05525 [Salinisphaeraceae bacterium]|nr:hypothetical protein [Salinisphaeraceae bacterium]
MIKKSVAVLPLLACLGFSHSAQAEELAYSFLEATAVLTSDYEVDQPNVDDEPDGFGVAFAFLMGPIAYSEWRYTQYDVGSGADGVTASVRFGAHQRLNSYGHGKLDLYGGVGAQIAEFESPNGNNDAFIDDTGVLGYIGLRHAFNQHFEIGGELGINNVEEAGRHMEIHAQWNATHAVSFRATLKNENYEVSDAPDVELTALTLGARVTFGQGG